jgi:hypothetical protein
MMTSITESLIFNSVSGKKVQADFDGGEVTSDAGVLLLRESEQHVGIINNFTNSIHDRRDQRYVTQELKDILSQRIYQIASGYEDANDSKTLRSDPAFKLAVNRLPVSGEDLASQPTISRLENAATRSDLHRLGCTLVDNFIASYPTAPPIIILDFDDTNDDTHGMQQLCLYNDYYNSYCYQPLHVYEGLSGKLISSVLRPGKRPTGKQIVMVLKRIVQKIRSSWPETLILFRGDSHFCTPETLQYCDENDLLYGIGLSGNAVLQRSVTSLIAEAKAVFAQSKIKVKLYETFTYQAGSWDKPHKVVVKVECSKKGTNVRFVVTNLTEPDPATIYKQIYCGRGQMENYIKDHKRSLKSDRTSCHSFEANQFRLFLHSAAYVLMHSLRENILKGTELAQAQFDTIRLKILKVGAKVREMKTRIKLHLPSSFPYKSIFYKASAVFSAIRVT